MSAFRTQLADKKNRTDSGYLIQKGHIQTTAAVNYQQKILIVCNTGFNGLALPVCDEELTFLCFTVRTLSRLTQNLLNRNAHSVRTCTLLDKPSRREVDFVPDFCGTQIPDEFVVGYGLDYAEKYRNLPYIGILKPEVYE